MATTPQPGWSSSHVHAADDVFSLGAIDERSRRQHLDEYISSLEWPSGALQSLQEDEDRCTTTTTTGSKHTGRRRTSESTDSTCVEHRSSQISNCEKSGASPGRRRVGEQDCSVWARDSGFSSDGEGRVVPPFFTDAMNDPTEPQGRGEPEVLLSLDISEYPLRQKAPPPHLYTVQEFLNIIISNNIKLPTEAEIQGDVTKNLEGFPCIDLYNRAGLGFDEEKVNSVNKIIAKSKMPVALTTGTRIQRQARSGPTWRSFLEAPRKVQELIMRYTLLTTDFVTPYQYKHSSPNLTKPNVNLLMALTNKKAKMSRTCSDARAILYHENRFLFNHPRDFVWFSCTVGWENLKKLKMGTNIAMTLDFFVNGLYSDLEMLWLANWATKLKIVLKGGTNLVGAKHKQRFFALAKTTNGEDIFAGLSWYDVPRMRRSMTAMVTLRDNLALWDDDKWETGTELMWDFFYRTGLDPSKCNAGDEAKILRKNFQQFAVNMVDQLESTEENKYEYYPSWGL